MALKQIHIMVDSSVIDELTILFPDRGMRSFIVRRLLTKFVSGCKDGNYKSTDEIIAKTIKEEPLK